MVSTGLGSLAVVAYIAALMAMLVSLRCDAHSPVGPASRSRRAALVLGWLGLILHSLMIAGLYTTGGGPSFSFLSALSLVTLLITGIVLVAALFRPVDKLGIVGFPLAAVILTLKLAVTDTAHTVSDHSWRMTLHIYSSLIAYSFLNIAAIQAVLLAIQDWCLRRRHAGGVLVRSLPPLQSMESLLFQLIGAGLLLLSISLVSGFLFLDDMFAQHLAHKTVLSLLAWLVFATLLVGRVRQGWRGQTAIRWTLAGFASLMLAYFGSKLVLELILNRV